MKLVFLAIIALTTSAYGEGQIQDLIKEKCAANSNNLNDYTELQNAVANIAHCIVDGVKGEVPHDFKDFEGNCKFLKRSNMVACLTDLATKMKPCLSKDEQFLPDFIVKFYTSALNKLCSAENAQKMKKILSSNDYLTCIQQNSEAVNACRPKLTWINGLIHSDFFIKKEDLCSRGRAENLCNQNDARSMLGNIYSACNSGGRSSYRSMQ